ncbi:MAG: zeta toxin family protein, partial [Butyrivibrio sp.]|nr:zeta toxin family protein [Butyrivibrio sp.]
MIFNMTGQPVSQEMADAIDRLGQGEYIPCEELKKIPEVSRAYSILKEEEKKTNIDPENRESQQDSVYAAMEQITSATVDENGKIVVDENGETVYNGIVNREARLDIVIGLPASGKSSSLVDPISSEFHSRLIDNDEAKKRFPKYNNGWGAAAVHKESKDICNKLFRDCILEKENIVLPKVGSDSTKLLESYIQKAKEEGYRVYVHFADLDRNKTLGRMLSRYCEDGRFLKPELADKYAPVIEGKTQNCIQEAYEVLKASGM